MSAEITGVDLNPGGHPSRLALARLLAGDYDESGKLALEAHIASCLHCTGIFENAKLDAADFARRRPSLESLESRSRRPGAPAPASGWAQRLRELLDRGFGMRPALAGFALLALASVVWVLNGRNKGPGPDDLSAKGTARFEVFLNGKQMHADTLACAPMDTLQLVIVAAEPIHYIVLYRDDGGGLTPYMVGDDQGGRPLGTPRGEPLPHSLVLGAGWRREILFCIWSPRSFTLSEGKARAGNEGASAGDLHIQIIPLANRGP